MFGYGDADVIKGGNLHTEGARFSVMHGNGTEFACFTWLRDELSMATYFIDPYSGGWRVSNEKRDGMIRRYLPERCAIGMGMSRKVQEIVDRINHWSMCVLGYRTSTGESLNLQA